MPNFTANFTTATELTPEIEKEIEDAFKYHAWDDKQAAASANLQAVMITAVKAIIEVVPPSADRSAALRKIREAMWACKAAITFKGKY